jgi:hypothetical protein
LTLSSIAIFGVDFGEELEPTLDDNIKMVEFKENITLLVLYLASMTKVDDELSFKK